MGETVVVVFLDHNSYMAKLSGKARHLVTTSTYMQTRAWSEITIDVHDYVDRQFQFSEVSSWYSIITLGKTHTLPDTKTLPSVAPEIEHLLM